MSLINQVESKTTDLKHDRKTYWEKGSKHYQVAQNQNWRCPVCGDPLFNGEALNTHHQVLVSKGGTDSNDNLVHLHQACHHHLHRMKNSGLLKA